MDPAASKINLMAMVDVDWHRAIQEGLDSTLIYQSASSSEILIQWQEHRLRPNLELSLWSEVDWNAQTLLLPTNVGLPEHFELHFSVAVKLINRYIPTDLGKPRSK